MLSCYASSCCAQAACSPLHQVPHLLLLQPARRLPGETAIGGVTGASPLQPALHCCVCLPGSPAHSVDASAELAACACPGTRRSAVHPAWDQDQREPLLWFNMHCVHTFVSTLLTVTCPATARAF